MIRNNGALWGLGLAVVAACQGGGSGNDFGVGPADDAPTHIGSPSDPNEPPGSRDDNPPFGDVAPPGNDTPPGTTTPPIDCVRLCRDAGAAGCDFENCREDCANITGPCAGLAGAFLQCAIDASCDEQFLDNCIDELDALDACEDGDPDPPDGEGGQGGM